MSYLTSVVGPFTHHEIPTEHAHLCEGMLISRKLNMPLATPSCLVEIAHKHRGNEFWYFTVLGGGNSQKVSDSYLALPKHMPTPWDMERLAAQGVDTDILTAEQIMALRVHGWKWLARDIDQYCGRSLWAYQDRPSFDELDDDWMVEGNNAPVPMVPETCLPSTSSLLNLNTLELADEGGAE